MRGRRRRGYELKRADAPRLTPSMRIARDELKLDSLDVVYPGDDVYPLADRIRAVGITRLEGLAPL